MDQPRNNPKSRITPSGEVQGRPEEFNPNNTNLSWRLQYYVYTSVPFKKRFGILNHTTSQVCNVQLGSHKFYDTRQACSTYNSMAGMLENLSAGLYEMRRAGPIAAVLQCVENN